MPKKKKEN